ncbi:hypothetical protein F7725_022267, partial [Dissostichus mawsoni]
MQVHPPHHVLSHTQVHPPHHVLSHIQVHPPHHLQSHMQVHPPHHTHAAGKFAPPADLQAEQPAFGPPIDPADWPSVLPDSFRTDLVGRGPFQVDKKFTFPREDGRSFHHHYFHRILVNGEKIKRTWLIYSRKNDALYCFCCKLFSRKDYKLMTEGLSNWRNIGMLLKSHKSSPEHTTLMATWKDFELYEPIADAMKRLETTFFNVVVDTTIESLKDRFETLGEVRARFGVLLNLKKLDGVELCNECDKLCSTLSTGDGGDIDGKELALEITNLPSLPT